MGLKSKDLPEDFNINMKESIARSSTSPQLGEDSEQKRMGASDSSSVSLGLSLLKQRACNAKNGDRTSKTDVFEHSKTLL